MSTDNREPTAAGRLSRRLFGEVDDFTRAVPTLIVGSFLIAALSTLLFGYHPFDGNGLFQIPLLRARLHQELFRSDYVLSVINYPSVLWGAVTTLSRVFGFESTLLLLCAVQNTLFHFAVAALALVSCRTVFWALACSAFFLSMPQTWMGGSFFYEPLLLTHTAMSVPFILLAVTLFLKRRLVWGLAAWLVALAIHLPNGIYAGAMVVILALFCRQTFVNLVKSRPFPVACGALLVGAFLLAAVYVGASTADKRTVSWQQYRELIAPGIGGTLLHIDWAENTSERWRVSVLLAQAALIIVSVVGAWRRAPELRPLGWSMLGLLVPLGIGIAATELMHSVSLARGMWMRVGDFLCLFALLFPLALAGRREIIGPAGLRLALPLFAYGIVYPAYANPAWYWAAALAFLLLVFVRLPAPGGFGLLSRAGFKTNLMVGALALSAALFQFTPKAIAFAGTSRITARWYTDYVAAQTWARSNSPQSSVFLTPVYLSGWRVYSERSTYLELRDRAAAAISDKVLVEFLRRSKVLGMPQSDYGNADQYVPKYNALPDELLKQLAVTERVSYGVFEIWKPTSLPVVYSNTSFKIVALDPVPASDQVR